MLIIRQAQIEALRSGVLDNFDRQIRSHLLSHYSERVADMSEESLQWRVKLATAKARSYKLTWDRTISVFSILMFQVSPYFDQQPKIKAVLADTAIADLDVRFEQLFTCTTVVDWTTSKLEQLESDWAKYEEQIGGKPV